MSCLEQSDEVGVIPLTGKCYRHKKTGNVYRVVLADCRIEATNTEAVAYQRADMAAGIVWVRPYEEFADGRFERAPEAD